LKFPRVYSSLGWRVAQKENYNILCSNSQDYLPNHLPVYKISLLKIKYLA